MPQAPEPSSSAHLTYAQAARQLHVHVDTVRRWVVDGKLPAIRLSANLVRIRPEDLERFVAAHRTVPTRSR